ncbi:MAG TPA: hypothetical protein PK388_09070 [Kiritimatiellia bacterium]|nr:hypothetical protein [Kiritimatiellia bacterium]
MKAKWMILATCAALSIATGTGAQNPALADLSAAQVEALRQAISLAEPAETVQAVFADIAVAPPGTRQQDVLRARLSADNLSIFCLTGDLNREGAAAGYAYGNPGLDQIADASMRTTERGNVVALDDLRDVRWETAADGTAQGGFAFDVGTGYKGACLFQAKPDGEAWKIVRLAIQKTGSDKLEDGWIVFEKP